MRRFAAQFYRGVGACLLPVMFSDLAWGHGWVTWPPSRQDHCAKHRTSFDCGAIQYEPQSVEAPKGSMLCSGGSRFSVLDSGGPWPETAISSHSSFTWQLTVAHRTTTWEYFVDGRHWATFDQGNSVPPTSVTHTLQGLPKGRHTILARWNIGDTPMAFYSCVDVQVHD